MKGKKTAVWIAAALAIVVLCTGSFLMGNQVNLGKEKYFIIGETLQLDQKIFTRQSVVLSALQLGKQIGVTDDKQQVYSINGMDKTKWICVRIGGEETLYRESSTPVFSYETTQTNKMIIKDEGALGGNYTEITDQNVIDSIMAGITDQNIVNMPDEIKNLKEVNLYFDELPGICYTLYYGHDIVNNFCFLLDTNSETFWRIGPELMQQMM